MAHICSSYYFYADDSKVEEFVKFELDRLSHPPGQWLIQGGRWEAQATPPPPNVQVPVVNF